MACTVHVIDAMCMPCIAYVRGARRSFIRQDLQPPPQNMGP